MLGETDLRLWPRPRSELRARLRNPLSPPISLGEARIRRKRSLELRLRLAWGGGARIALFSRGEGQGQLGTRAQSTGACRKRVLKSELGEEKRPGKKKGGRRAREKGRDAKSQAGRRPHQELAGPRRREEVGTGRAKQRRRASREPAPPPPASRCPLSREQPVLSSSLGRKNKAGQEARTRPRR